MSGNLKNKSEFIKQKKTSINMGHAAGLEDSDRDIVFQNIVDPRQIPKAITLIGLPTY